jgi:hypothetical protein
MLCYAGESAAISAVLSWTGLEVEAGMGCDFYRTNYSIGSANRTYLGYTEFLSPPVIDNDDRYPGRNISLSHSSYIFPNMSYNDLLHGLSAAQQSNRDRMSKIDPIAQAIYTVKEDILQSFIVMVRHVLFVISSDAVYIHVFNND